MLAFATKRTVKQPIAVATLALFVITHTSPLSSVRLIYNPGRYVDVASDSDVLTRSVNTASIRPYSFASSELKK